MSSESSIDSKVLGMWLEDLFRMNSWLQIKLPGHIVMGSVLFNLGVRTKAPWYKKCEYMEPRLT